MNTILTILLGSATAIFVPFTIIFFIRNFSKWEDKQFSERYGAFYDGLRTDRISSVFFHIFFMLRRIAFTLIAIYASHLLFVQIMILLLTSTI